MSGYVYGLEALLALVAVWAVGKWVDRDAVYDSAGGLWGPLLTGTRVVGMACWVAAVIALLLTLVHWIGR